MAQPITPNFPLAATYPDSDGQLLVPLLTKTPLAKSIFRNIGDGIAVSEAPQPPTLGEPEAGTPPRLGDLGGSSPYGIFRQQYLTKRRLGEVLQHLSAVVQNGIKDLLSKGSGFEQPRVRPHRLRHLSLLRRGLSRFPVPLIKCVVAWVKRRATHECSRDRGSRNLDATLKR